MSTLTADPGFPRGAVLGVTQKMYDAEPSNGSTIVGVVKTFRDENPTTGVVLSNRTVDCIAVRNTSGGMLEPGTVVRFSPAGVLSEVDQYAEAADALVGIVDEYLPETLGAPKDEVFWLVVKGPSSVWKLAGTAIDGNAVVCVSSTSSGEIGPADPDATEVGVQLEDASDAEQKVRVLVKTRAS